MSYLKHSVLSSDGFLVVPSPSQCELALMHFVCCSLGGNTRCLLEILSSSSSSFVGVSFGDLCTTVDKGSIHPIINFLFS